MRLTTRPPVKQDEIVEHLRGQIVKGELKPGDRLPTRLDIEERFMVSSLTVQRAFDRLIDDGFITASGRKGTFVSENPPHLHQYAITFPHSRGDSEWVRFWSVLDTVARSYERSGKCRITPYEGINKVRTGEDFDALSEAVNARRLAGIIFATNPFVIEGTPILDLPGIPRVAMMGRAEHKGVATITFEPKEFLERAVEFLVKKGRKRIAFLLVANYTRDPGDSVREVLKEHNLPFNPIWAQMCMQSEARWVQNLTLAIMQGKSGERPDGLVIVDDNLTEHACAGLLQAGLQVPRDLDVVAHCNFPSPVPGILPITRLGYDIHQLLDECIGVLERQRLGETSPEPLLFGPRFEWEVPANHAQPELARS